MESLDEKIEALTKLLQSFTEDEVELCYTKRIPIDYFAFSDAVRSFYKYDYNDIVVGSKVMIKTMNNTVGYVEHIGITDVCTIKTERFGNEVEKRYRNELVLLK